ncbi:hypothetical protein ASG40_15040 [Methylobacterium sp. Leaf399]|uniref:response regulator n=1 Tax=unclassified Methylobacterium TaxID=2615210 RepID=UPI0007019FAC|nr:MULTISPECIES: response regulator [unclassified Methylobacterium]KQP50297.1 hypothetical protein ASF39_13380 [Methylobacterium sp. Leaf108]KQT07297.1 hypothetical protein ASG40_15040 [Methylobacterium sp. Leaf399]
MSTPLRVMIVEDEAVIQMQLEMLLEDAGHIVVATAFSAEEAIADAHRTRPDVVFVDMRLRGRSSGLDVVDAIRAIEGTIIVFVTANAADLDEECDGAAAVIAKPFSVGVIEESLRYIEECVHRPPPEAKRPLGLRVAPSYDAHLESFRRPQSGSDRGAQF